MEEEKSCCCCGGMDKTTLRPAYWRDVTANLVEV